MREKTGDIILPLLFATALVTLTLSVYTRWAPLFALPVLAGVRLVFFLCAWLKQKRTAISVLAYLAVGALTALPFYLISLGVSRDPFALADQLKNGSPAAPGLIALAALLCFFTASGVYYCTRVNITLTTAAFIIIIPCMLYASRLTLVPPVYAAIVIPLFIAVLIDCRRSEATQGLSLINLRPYCLIIGAAAVLLAAAALIMPKADVTPFDYFRLLYGNYERLSARSGDNPPERADNERPLFEVRATEPLYLKRQVFGVFTLGGWNVVADNFFIARDGWETERARLGVNNLLRLIRQAAELDADFAARYAPDGFLPAAGAGAATARTAEIRHLGMRSTYIPHPETSFEVTGLPAGELALQMPTGELLLYNSRLPGDVIYNLSYYSQIPEEHVLAFLESFNYERLLSDMEKVFNRANQSRAWTEVRTFETERRQAAEFQAATPILPPERAAGLAVLTTAGLRSDFAKAAAIENFFHENGYVYDLDFSPPRNYEDDIEYFIFSSRRGACSDFATAMTLMARAAGLNARYVEGFYAPPP
ncbi:MAG: transglutaminase-like domain-containing protein, partial [Gracilibacteraceae bacterium]|nr:transglutaminase-like domain-containing protein [Gracilibacteraceae bacterium]